MQQDITSLTQAINGLCVQLNIQNKIAATTAGQLQKINETLQRSNSELQTLGELCNISSSLCQMDLTLTDLAREVSRLDPNKIPDRPPARATD